MMIFSYLSRELFLATGTIVGILLMVFSTHVLVRYLTEVAVGRYPVEFVLQMIALEMPNLMSLLLPLSFYLAILYVYGRLHGDNEMTIIYGSGISKNQVLRMTLTAAGFVAFVVALLMLWVCPSVMEKREQLRHEARSKALIEMLTPGGFRTFLGGEKAIYVENISKNRRKAWGVFLVQQNQTEESKSASSWDVVVAKSASLEFRDQDHEEYLVLDEGTRYIGSPGKADFQVVHFKQYGVKIPEANVFVSQQIRAQSTIKLIQSLGTKAYDGLAELQWRLSLPISVLVLTVLGMGFTGAKPRQGRYMKMVPAIIIYILYANFMFVARDWVKTQRISPELGMWWVHGVFLIIGLMIFYQSEWMARYKRWMS